MLDQSLPIYMFGTSKKGVISEYVRGYQMYTSLKNIHSNVILLKEYSKLIKFLKKNNHSSFIITLESISLW